MLKLAHRLCGFILNYGVCDHHYPSYFHLLISGKWYTICQIFYFNYLQLNIHYPCMRAAHRERDMRGNMCVNMVY